MATQQAQHLISLEAGQDLSSKQFFFVSIASDGQVDPTGNGAAAAGVLQNDPSVAGSAATVCVGGVTKVSVGATVAAGAAGASDAAGECVPAASGDVILGTALEGGTDGAIISILFNPRGAAA